MKKLLGATLFVTLLTASPALAQGGGFALYGSYWNTSDVEETFGGGLSLAFPFGASGFGLELRGTYYQELTDEPFEGLFDDDENFFEDESLEVLPLEAGLRYTFPTGGAFSPWISGGASYMLLDSTREGIDVDDETGWYVSAGSRFGDDEGIGFFAEALYRSTEATVRRDPEDLGDVDDIDVADEVAIDLDGVGVNAGIVWAF